MDTSPADSPSRVTVSVRPIPETCCDPCNEETGTPDNAVSSTYMTDVEQNDNFKAVEQNGKTLDDVDQILEQNGKTLDDVDQISKKFETLEQDRKNFAKVEENAKTFEYLFHIESWPKQISYNRNNSVGGLSMVKEEGDSFRSVDTKQSAHHIPPVKKRSKSKIAVCMSCFLHPFKRLRDMYISCCFQIAGAGDLAGLVVGGGHTVGNFDLFPVARENSDDEEEKILRRRRKGKR